MRKQHLTKRIFVARHDLWTTDSKGQRNYYMRRWFLQTPWFTVRLHHILRSDSDRHLHDHPWSFWSFLLSGGYVEVTPAGQRYCPRFSLVRRKATDIHRLVLTKPVWTLVVSGPKVREWGFTVDGRWVHHRDYDALCNTDGPAPATK